MKDVVVIHKIVISLRVGVDTYMPEVPWSFGCNLDWSRKACRATDEKNHTVDFR
jgi:hypothetical protein